MKIDKKAAGISEGLIEIEGGFEIALKEAIEKKLIDPIVAAWMLEIINRMDTINEIYNFELAELRKRLDDLEKKINNHRHDLSKPFSGKAVL